MNLNAILLRRKNKMLVPTGGRTPKALIAAFNLNIQSLGYTLSPALIRALEHTSQTTATKILSEALITLKDLKGVRNYKPFYPNFPLQVMEATDCELYFNAMNHYWSFLLVDLTGDSSLIWFPKYDKEKRAHLDEKIELRVIGLATEKEVTELGTQIATANTSISASDKDDLRKLYEYGFLEFPSLIPHKENLAFMGALFFNHNFNLEQHFRTSTDILRLATALSNGDVSLSDDSRFRNFTRPERKLLLGLLEQCETLEEDMIRWEMRWKRLGERLHPGSYKKFARVRRAFDNLRNNKITTIRTHIEAAVRSGNTVKAISLLSQRPGEFARRLNHLLVTATTKTAVNRAVEAFLKVAPDVSTPVLLQARSRFMHRDEERVVFPKGNVARVMSLDKPVPYLPQTVINAVVEGIEETLSARFAKLPKLGKVYIDPLLQDCLVPFSQRSASKSLRTLVRGSKLPFGNDKNTLRFFIWWKEPKNDRTDLDLSATLLDRDFEMVESLTYYNLRGDFGCHSGDVTSAPNGASEFIDINIPQAIKSRGRYIVMSVHGFTEQNFCDLPECYAGWMLRDEPQSGEIYDPRTVNDKVDVAMEARTGIPMIIDIVDRKVIWVDASMSHNAEYSNNVRNNKGTIKLLGKALTRVHKPNLYDLLSLHVEARGKLVTSPDKADVVFSVKNGTPFELERIASEFMSDVKPKTKAAKR